MDEATTETVETEHTETEATDAEETETQETEVEDPAAGLKSALQKERKANKDKDKRIKELEREAADRGKSDDELAIDEARREATAEATAKANAKIVAAEFRVAAAKRVKDPRIAAKLADLTEIEVDDDGNVDADAIESVIDALIADYPSLTGSRFEGTADQGGAGKSSAPSQLTRDDLKNMSPQAITKADREGRLDRIKGKIK